MTLVLGLPGAVEMAREIAARLGVRSASVGVHRFPDGEQRVRIVPSLIAPTVILVAALDRPDGKILPLIFAADLARELGATRVGLVAPYLPYMRQDHRFTPGEAISSRSLARVLSGRLDFLVTVEPHLHRWLSLDAVFDLQARAVSASGPMARWIREHVRDPVLIGPDVESRQWVARIAAELQAPFAVLNKTRGGDRDVSVALPEAAITAGTPVIVDDIVSTGRTILTAAQALQSVGRPVRHCVCVHALLDAEADGSFAAAGIRLASCDSVIHRSNAIALAPTIAEALQGGVLTEVNPEAGGIGHSGILQS